MPTTTGADVFHTIQLPIRVLGGAISPWLERYWPSWVMERGSLVPHVSTKVPASVAVLARDVDDIWPLTEGHWALGVLMRDGDDQCVELKRT